MATTIPPTGKYVQNYDVLRSDIIDRTHAIIRNLQRHGLPGRKKARDQDKLCYHRGQKVDYVYV